MAKSKKQNSPATPKKASTDKSQPSTPAKSSPSKDKSPKKASAPVTKDKSPSTQHAYPAYKRRFRVLLMGFPANSTSQQLLNHFNIVANQVHGVQFPSDRKDVAFAYFVTHEFAVTAVSAWNSVPNKVGFMFLQRVHTSFKYKIDLEFNCESLLKVLEHVPDIVGMNFTPSTKFWAVSTNDALIDNKPQFLEAIDTSKTTFRLKWHPDATVDWNLLRQSISSSWRIPVDSVQVNQTDNVAYVMLARIT